MSEKIGYCAKCKKMIVCNMDDDGDCPIDCVRECVSIDLSIFYMTQKNSVKGDNIFVHRGCLEETTVRRLVEMIK